MYIGAIVFGAVYVYSWIVGTLAALTGLAIHVIFNHYYTFPICTLIAPYW